MTAETVLNNVMLSLKIDKTGVQLTSNDYETRQLLHCINQSGHETARRVEWAELYKDYNVAAGLSEIALPSDFNEMAESGSVRLNNATFTPLRPIVSPEQWALIIKRPSEQVYYHLSGGKILFSKSLTDGATVRYSSSYWVDGKPQITQNSDQILIPEELVEKGAVWRWKRINGLHYQDLFEEFETNLIAEIKASRGQG